MPKRPASPTIKREVDELSLLYDISQTLEQCMALQEAAAPILNILGESIGFSHIHLTLVNRQSGEIYIDSAYGLSPGERERGRYQPGEGITGLVAKTGKAEIVPQISRDPRFLGKTGSQHRQHKEFSFVCVPVRMGQEVIGTIGADHPYEEDRNLNDEVRIISIVAAMIAQAVKMRQSVEEERQRLLEENQRLHDELRERFRPSNIIGNSKAMQAVYDLIAQVTQSDATVLIRGESGTGKELVAHAIHYNSQRANRAYIKVNCAALPETILEAELFGYERGAFTGALARKKGRFELADGGTIFLDEVGDFSPATQVKLLRVLQEREFERVGGTETIKANVRILAATNRNLEELVTQGKFRDDLYYRLNVFPIHLPALRERKSDILLLADHFVAKYANANGKDVRRISTPAIDMMMAYHWPGNVRELENCIERAVLLTNDQVIHGHHLPPTLQTAETTNTSPKGTLQEVIDRVECEMIVEALKTARGNCAKAAKSLGVTERVMGLRLMKYNITYKRFRSGIIVQQQ